jgi:TPR repeat protein
MTRKSFLVFSLWFIYTSVFAFQGDYVLEANFKVKLEQANKGDMKAQYDTGERYEKGMGVEENQKKAFFWFSKAAKQGSVKAFNKLGVAYLNGQGVEKDMQKAYEWLRQAANKKNARAFFHLGEIYEYGYGKRKNLKESLRWYKRSKNNNFGPANSRVERLIKKIKKQRANESSTRIAQDNLLKKQALQDSIISQRLTQETSDKEAAEKKRKMNKLRVAEDQRSRQQQLQRKQAEQGERERIAKVEQERKKLAQLQRKLKENIANKKKTKTEFVSDPCKGRAARYMSTCR